MKMRLFLHSVNFLILFAFYCNYLFKSLALIYADSIASYILRLKLFFSKASIAFCVVHHLDVIFFLNSVIFKLDLSNKLAAHIKVLLAIIVESISENQNSKALFLIISVI
jgi:hypothetical protein